MPNEDTLPILDKVLDDGEIDPDSIPAGIDVPEDGADGDGVSNDDEEDLVGDDTPDDLAGADGNEDGPTTDNPTPD